MLICRMQKPEGRKGKILFINAVDEVKSEKTTSLLEEKHIQKILKAYREHKDIPLFARVVKNEEILNNNAMLSIPLYVSRTQKEEKNTASLQDIYTQWEKSSDELYSSLDELINTLEKK